MNVPLILFVIVMTIITIAAFSFTVRGLLGVNFSFARLVAAGAIAFLLGSVINRAILGPELVDSSELFPAFWFYLLSTGISLLAGMVFLVIAELLVPSNTLPGPVYMARAFRRLLNRAARYTQITGIILRRGLGAYLRGGRRAELKTPEGRAALARQLRAALNEGGVTFIKLGQILSTRRDLLPPEFIAELSLLQDKAAHLPWEEIHAVLREELVTEDVHDAFASFDREPLAAASIAQVHTARLVSGEEVVVKVRRPGITAQVERDLDIVVRLAERVQRSTAWGRSIGAVDLANGFAAALREELDLRVEARNLAVVGAAEARSARSSLHIPVVYGDLSTERVLVMERIRGIPLGEAGCAIDERGLDRHTLARDLLTSLLRQIVIDGTFHADPHPGNIMLLENNRLTLLDFGSVGRIDAVLRGALVRLLLTFEHGDPIAATDALLDLVERPEALDEHRLERTLGQFMALYLAPGVPPDVRMFADLFRIIAEFGLAVPPEVAAVFRAIATLEGTLTAIAPGFNIVGEARSFAAGYLGEQLRPQAVQKTLTEELTTLLPMLRRLPRRLDRITSALEDGRLNVNVRPLANAQDQRVMRGMLHEALLTVLASTAGLMAVIMIGQDGGPAMTEEVSMFQFLGYALLVLAFILAMRVLVLIFRPVRE
jgi:ubiquinone biosynthesis protein